MNVAQQEAPKQKAENQQKKAFEEMTVRELRGYAEKRGVDLEGLQKKREIIAALKGAE